MPVEFEISLIVKGDEIAFDLSGAPDALNGPVNSPLPSTISACRVVLAFLASRESLNEGYFTPLRIITRVGSMFHPVAPQPTFMYGGAVTQLMEALFQAFAAAMPGQVASGSAGDLCGLMVYAYNDKSGEMSAAGVAMPIGLGGAAEGDGTTLVHLVSGTLQLTSAELMEAKFDFLHYENWELEQDSAGAGEFRGGLGWKVRYRFLRDVSCMLAIDRTKVPSWTQAGGSSGTPNKAVITYPDGRVVTSGKVTGVALPKGTILEITSGGGGGYGMPTDRDVDRVRRDVHLGYISEEKARELYPHAVE